ncbi:EpsG family protein [Clostridium arbusti]|uniref:EpsG family protein n=1 Tax=Clostridium arbusti TaxID=1137848 RepID=UPI00028A1C5F|nr:EpsG family protein [Clostridium arbusti]
MFNDSVLFYVVIITITTFCAILTYNRILPKIIRNIFSIATVFIPSIFAGLRYGIGTDFLGRYLPAFEGLKYNINYDPKFEIGFLMLNKFVIFIGGNINVVMFIMSLITTIFIWRGLRQYQKYFNPGIGMFIYMITYYQMSYNIVRQVAAMAILFYITKYIFERNILKFIFYLLIAMSIQVTSIIFLSVYFLYPILTKEKYKKMRKYFYILVLLFIINIEKIMFPILKAFSLDYYANYVKTDGIYVSYFFIFKCIVFLLPAFIYSKRILIDQTLKLQYSFVVLGCILMLTGYMGTSFTVRISFYFNLSLITIIPMVYTKLKQLKYFYLGQISIVSLILFWYIEYFIMLRSETVPYMFFFGQ